MNKYNCSVDLKLSAFENAVNILGNTPVALYLSDVTNLAFHDLTDDKSVPPSARLLLGLGQKFIPAPKYSSSCKDMNEHLFRFRRDLYRAVFWGEDSDKSEDEDDIMKRPRLKLPSEWIPNESEIPDEIIQRLLCFFNEMEKIYKRRPVRSNLRPFELKLLQTLQADDSLIIANADKGLGPVAVKLQKYITDALVHLEDKSTYDIISCEEAKSLTTQIVRDIDAWIDKFKPYTSYERKRKVRRPHAGALREKEIQFIRQKTYEAFRKSPNAYFYLLYKLHKTPLKTRPVSSTCGSIAEAIGKFVDKLLRPIAQTQRSFFRDSFVLKKRLDEVLLPPNALLFTMDATSMYSNIDSDAALAVLSEYLRRPNIMKQFDYNVDCLIEAIGIVLRSNILKFGDIFAVQKKGVAMGICPAPSIAIIFYAVHEEYLMMKWGTSIPFYLRFIDDVFGVWLANPNYIIDDRSWKEFQKDVNKFHGLPWEFIPRTSSVTFMDLSITINGDRLSTDLYEKPMALYLYIPPRSSHPPGGINGLITGQMLRIFALCSDKERIKTHALNFLRRLIARGYTRQELLPMFESAAKNARNYLQRTEEQKTQLKRNRTESNRRCIRLHRYYNPADPPTSALQRLFKECIFAPPGRTPLNELENFDGSKIPIDKLMICNHRHMNLGNYLSYRNIEKRQGEKASAHLQK